MDAEKRIKALLEENEFLQNELEDANKMLLANQNTSEVQSPAYINSQIDLNKIEIQHLQQQLQEEQQRLHAFQYFNEELEYDLLQMTKKNKAQNDAIEELTANKIHVEVIQEELDGMSDLMKKLRQQKSDLAAANSTIEMQQVENDSLRAEIQEMQDLVKFWQNKKL
jgi:DNA repair exonuclease SbcCD ATPase subunit